MPTKRTSKQQVEDLKKQKHYTDLDIEPIEVIHAWVDDPSSHFKACTLKYLGRHHSTKEIKDLKKAQVYLEWLIKEVS